MARLGNERRSPTPTRRSPAPPSRARAVGRRLSRLGKTSGGRGKPLAESLVDEGMVEQRDVVRAADAHAVLRLERDPARAASARGARLKHEAITQQPRDGM